ncbi:glycosyltransferase family 2 protein [Pseudoclavibacter sp. RFBG4]|uniref:glycosyltransferase family 2 protein n=1 Tax=Pseudoclavibacter sp. RFBG4 TaxID=2080575 RepID=UPI0015E379FC|nr:glycosyltransferase family 2 protein [Pseudoclavibacter sp. RFBG4]
MNSTSSIDSISVVIPHYGDPTDAQALLAVLQGGVSRVPVDFIVVDDASPISFPETKGVQVLRRTENGGFGTAVNTGIRAAAGTHVLVLNSDLSVSDSFLDDLVARAAEHGDKVVSPHVVGHSGEAQWVGRRFPSTTQYLVEWLTVLARFRGTAWWHRAVGHDLRCVAGAVVEVDWVMGAAMLLPREAVRSAGGFDELFYMNCEEIDLQRRLRREGVPALFLGTVEVAHEGGASTDPLRRRRWLVDSRFKYAEKWHERPALQRSVLVCASLVNFVTNGARQVAGRPISARRILREELGLLR